METGDGQKYLDAANALTVLQVAARDAYESLKALGDKGLGITTELDLVGLSHKLAGHSENLRRDGLATEVGGWPPKKSDREKNS